MNRREVLATGLAAALDAAYVNGSVWAGVPGAPVATALGTRVDLRHAETPAEFERLIAESAREGILEVDEQALARGSFRHRVNLARRRATRDGTPSGRGIVDARRARRVGTGCRGTRIHREES